jgi:PEP-CTERM motif
MAFQTKFMSLVVSSLLLTLPQTASATAYVLDFNSIGGNCAGVCTNSEVFFQTMGDIAGVVDVSHRSLVGIGNSAVKENFLKFYATEYGDLNGIAFGGIIRQAQPSVPEITFRALGAEGITLHGLKAGGWRSSHNTEFRVYDLAYNLLFSSGTVTAPRVGHIDVSLGDIFNQTGLVLQFGPTGLNTGIDNVRFSVANLTPGAVPEPASWAMMIAGFGLVGASMRRRTQVRFA